MSKRKDKFKRVVVPVGSIWPQPKKSTRQRYRYSWGRPRKTVICSTDMETTLHMVMKLIKQHEDQRTGVTSPDEHRFQIEDRKHINEHLADWKASMVDANRSAKHITNFFLSASAVLQGTPAADPSASRARGRARAAVTKPTGWQRVSEIVPSKVGSQVAAVKVQTTAGTANRYLDAVGAFLNWGVQDGRWARNVCDHLQRFPGTGVQRPRRVLAPIEFGALIDATERGPVRAGMTGQQRSLAYRTACACGLRAGEARWLPIRDAVLVGDNPGVWVDGSISKNKKRQFVPLPRTLAAELLESVQGRAPAQPLLPLPRSGNTARMIRLDLEAAGIEYVTAEGVFDFHGLRHECGALLMGEGVNVKAVQQHMRHSSMKLTMDTYGHLMPDDREHARRSLRSFDAIERGELKNKMDQPPALPEPEDGKRRSAMRSAQIGSKCRQVSPIVVIGPPLKGAIMENHAENADSTTVERRGIEPRFAECDSAVIPLDHRPG
jgi:integrase